MKRMTAAAYLRERGWILMEGVETCDGDADLWGDPASDSDLGSTAKDALVIQQARDREAERAHWSACMAARIGVCDDYDSENDANGADRCMSEYRKRFAVEIVEVEPRPAECGGA